MNESSKNPSSKPNATVTAAQAVLARRSNEQIPLSLGKASLRMRLEAYYSLISPDTLSNRTEWLRKYDQIYEKVGPGHLAWSCLDLFLPFFSFFCSHTASILDQSMGGATKENENSLQN